MGKFLLSTLLLLTTAFASTAADNLTLLTQVPTDGQPFLLWGANKYSGSFREGAVGAGNITSGYINAVILNSDKSSLVVPESLAIDDPSKVAYMAFESYNNTKVIKFVSGNNAGKYLKAGTSNNSLSVVETVADASTITVSIASTGAASIKLNDKVFLKYNATSATAARVTCYTGATTGSAYLFGVSVDSEKCATPMAKIGDKFVANGDKAFVNDELTFSCSTEGATITYSLIGGEYNINNEVFNGNSIKLNKAALYTIKAKATVDGKDASDELVIEDIDVVKRNADISFAKSTAAAYLDAVSEFSAPELLNPNKLEGISYTSSNTEIATVAADGTVAPLAAGETTITAAFAGNDEYEAAKAEYVLTVMNEKPNLPKFKKVTSVDDLEDGAHYVIAYESQDGSKAMGVALENDFRQATDVVISEGVLEATENTLIITLEGSVNSWKFNAENYFGTDKYLKFNQTNTTKILMTSESDATPATITFSTQGNVQIRGNVDGGTRYIKYNTATEQFRYYAETTGSMCQLYREIIEVAPEAPAMPQIHPEHADKVSGNTISGEGSMNIKFADVEDHINIYYRFIDNTAEPEVVALDETADNHEGYELYDKENGLNLGTEHHGKTLEVFACDSNTGKHSETAQYNISMLTVGVAEIEAAGAGEVRWFDMQGREIKGQPEKGIYVRVANGKASKVIL